MLALAVLATGLVDVAAQTALSPQATTGYDLVKRYPDKFLPGISPDQMVIGEILKIPGDPQNIVKYSLLTALFLSPAVIPMGPTGPKVSSAAATAFGWEVVKDVAEATVIGLVKSMDLTPQERAKWMTRVKAVKGIADWRSFLSDFSSATLIKPGDLAAFIAQLPDALPDLYEGTVSGAEAAGAGFGQSSGYVTGLVTLAKNLAGDCDFATALALLDQAQSARQRLADARRPEAEALYQWLALRMGQRHASPGEDPDQWTVLLPPTAVDPPVVHQRWTRYLGVRSDYSALYRLDATIVGLRSEIVSKSSQYDVDRQKAERRLDQARLALTQCDPDRGRRILGEIQEEFLAPKWGSGLKAGDACWAWIVPRYDLLDKMQASPEFMPNKDDHLVDEAYKRALSALDACKWDLVAKEIAEIEELQKQHANDRCLSLESATLAAQGLRSGMERLRAAPTCMPVEGSAMLDDRPAGRPTPAAPRCVSLQIVPDVREVRAGQVVTFEATASYDNGTTQDVTALAQWQPGPGSRYTAPTDLRFSQRVRISATYGSCVGSIEIVALPPSWTPPLSHADQIGARAEPAQPGDYTWFVLCPKEALDGTMVYGQQPSLARYHLVAGPFEGPRTADQWIKANCPRARCTADGACAQDPAYSPMPAWSVVCDKGDRRLYKTQSVNLARHWVLRERLLGEPDAELWIQRNCPSRLCADGGACAAADQYRTGGKWAVVCDRSHGGVGLTEYPNRGTQHVWIENLYAEVDARQWADRRCPSWRCDRDGRCLPGDRPLENTSAGRPVEVPLDTVLGLFGQREASRSSASQSAGSSTGGAALGSTGTTSRYGSGTLDGAMRERAEGSGGHGGSGGGTGPRTGTGTGSGTTTPGRCSGNADCPPGQQCSAAGVCVTVAGSGSTTTPATSTPGASTPAATPAPAPAPSAPAMPQKSWIVFHPCAATGGWWCLLQMANTTEAELRKKNKTLTILGSYPSENVALTTTCARISEVFRGGEFAPGYGSALGMVGGVKLAVGSFVIWNSASSSYRCRDRYYP